MNTAPQPLCRIDNAKAFKAKEISTEVYLDNMVVNFNETKHQDDDDRQDDFKFSQIDKINHSVKTCLSQPTFKPVLGDPLFPFPVYFHDIFQQHGFLVHKGVLLENLIVSRHHPTK
jgi:hypothetical protein